MDKSLYKSSQLEILKSLAKRGHEVSLFGMYSWQKLNYKEKNFRVILVPMRPITILASFMYAFLLSVSMPFYLSFSNVDYVIVEPQNLSLFSLISTRLFPKQRRPKIILDIRSTPVKRTWIENLLFNTNIFIGKQICDGMTIITPMMRTEVCNRYQINPLTVGVWSSGVSTTVFNPEKFDRIALRKFSGLDKKFVVFYHGALGTTYKYAQVRGLVDSIKSIGLLKKMYPDVVLFILGDSGSFPMLRKIVENCGIEDRVILHEKVSYEEVPKFIAMSDAGLIPLPNLAIWRNQCPLKLLEYGSMGKIIIATDIPANRYVLGTCDCAVFVPSASSEEIAKAISLVHDNFQSFIDSSKQERALIEKNYSWDQVASDFERYLLGINNVHKEKNNFPN